MSAASDSELPTDANRSPFDVFISYSSKDKTLADAVCHTLETQGMRCWIAPRDIAPGSDWAEAILDGLDACRAFVLVFTASANQSKHVLREVARACDNNLVVIPFRVEEIQPSRKFEYWIRQSHWLDAMTPPLQQHLDRLVQAVRNNLAPLTTKRPEPEASAPGASRVAKTPVERTPTSVPLGPGGPSYKLGDTKEFTLPGGVKHTLIWCPPGTFTMGSPTEDVGHRDNENQVEVTLTKGFWLGQTVVTQAMWTAVMKTTPWIEYGNESSYKVGTNSPAVYVNHIAATAFCEMLSKLQLTAKRLPTGWKYAIPTEAQWEYACRAGTTTAYSYGDDIGQLRQYARFEKNANNIGEKYAHPVAQKKPNPWGLFDMHGNVWEWCVDWYGDQRVGGTNPAGPASGSDRMMRGGSWFHSAEGCRSASRRKCDPSYRLYFLGFRLCLSSD